MFQARRSNEEDHRDGDGERRRDGRPLVPHSISKVCADGHSHYRVRFHSKLFDELTRVLVWHSFNADHILSREYR